MRGRLLYVNVYRGEDGGMSERFLEGNSTESGMWMEECREIEGVRNVLKENELNKSDLERAYQATLHGKCEVLKGGDVESVETKW